MRSALHKPQHGAPLHKSAAEQEAPVPMPGFFWREGRQSYILEPGAGAVEPAPQTARETFPEAPVVETNICPQKNCEVMPPAPPEAAAFSPSRLIGQFLRYLVVQRGEKLLIIDQHAAHERVIYESLTPEKPAKARAQQPCRWRLSAYTGANSSRASPVLAEMGYKWNLLVIIVILSGYAFCQ